MQCKTRNKGKKKLEKKYIFGIFFSNLNPNPSCYIKLVRMAKSNGAMVAENTVNSSKLQVGKLAEYSLKAI
jgi:hypothetical protein